MINEKVAQGHIVDPAVLFFVRTSKKTSLNCSYFYSWLKTCKYKTKINLSKNIHSKMNY